MKNEITNNGQFALHFPAMANIAAVEKVYSLLPEIERQTRAFDRQNSQTTLSMMSLTMLNGHSPMQLLRQVLAEIEPRKMALAEAQVSHAKLLAEIEQLEQKTDPVSIAELKLSRFKLQMLENKVNGSFKDIATLMGVYEAMKEKQGLDTWDETDFEKAEKRHHVRRGFELMYRNLLDGGRIHTSTIEYMQQFGVHPQIAAKEVGGYIQLVEHEIQSGNHALHSNHLEDFLDEMATKYLVNADITSERIFGKADFTNEDYMLKLSKPTE